MEIFIFKQDGYLDSHTSNFRISEATYPLIKLLHLNQVRVAIKRLNLLLYGDLRMIVQLVPFLCQPDDLKSMSVEENKLQRTGSSTQLLESFKAYIMIPYIMILEQDHETSSKTEYPQCSRRYPSYIKRSIATGIIENTLLD